MTVNVTEAKNRLTELLKEVEKGTAVTIERHGKPIARIVRPEDAVRPEPKFGTLGRYRDLVIDPDWAKPQNDIEAWLRGEV